MTRLRRGIEYLEYRRFLSASLDPDTRVLTVIGDENPSFTNDSISLKRELNNGEYKIHVFVANNGGGSSEYWFSYNNVDSVFVDAKNGDNRVEWIETNATEKPSTLRGGNGNDTLIGGDQADYLIGDVGGDSLVGGGGNDTMDASAGNDTLVGGSGTDLFLGGANIDTADFSYEGNRVFVSLDDSANDGIWFGSQPPASAEGDNVASSVERVRGTNALYGDFIIGSGKDNLFYGQAGNDTLQGYGGNDTLYGGDGDDVIDGGSGDDSIIGEAGSDLLQGSSDNDFIDASGDLLLNFDTLVGGSGNDNGSWDLLVDFVQDQLPG